MNREREGLSPGEAALVRISAAIGADGREELTTALRDALSLVEKGRLPLVAVEETLLQSHLFAGYPATIRALAAWRGVGGPASSQQGRETESRREERDADAWDERGASVCEAVYGEQYAKLRSRVAALHPELDRWMVRDGYGRVLGRPGLPLGTRELCIVALLCAQDSEPQLYAHMRGALQVGVEPGLVGAAIREACALLPAPREVAAWTVWARVRGSRDDSAGGTETRGGD